MSGYLRVEQEHIDRGKPWDGRYCPVALAAMDMFWALGAGIGHSTLTVWWDDPKRYLEYALTNEMRQFMYQFDRGGKPQPQQFKLYRMAG